MQIVMHICEFESMGRCMSSGSHCKTFFLLCVIVKMFKGHRPGVGSIATMQASLGNAGEDCGNYDHSRETRRMNL